MWFFTLICTHTHTLSFLPFPRSLHGGLLLHELLPLKFCGRFAIQFSGCRLNAWLWMWNFKALLLQSAQWRFPWRSQCTQELVDNGRCSIHSTTSPPFSGVADRTATYLHMPLVAMAPFNQESIHFLEGDHFWKRSHIADLRKSAYSNQLEVGSCVISFWQDHCGN